MEHPKRRYAFVFVPTAEGEIGITPDRSEAVGWILVSELDKQPPKDPPEEPPTAET